MKSNLSLGDRGEEVALQYLLERRYTLVARNFRVPCGELDLICLSPSQQDLPGDKKIVFVEVKTRTSLAFGRPEEAVNQSKIRRIREAAEAFLYLNPEYEVLPCQFDVIALLLSRHGHHIEHIEEAF